MIQLRENATKFELSPTLAANELAKKRIAAGGDIYHFGFGESPFSPPERLIKAVADNAHLKAYEATIGMTALCDVAGPYHAELAGVNVDEYDTIIAPGSKLLLYALQMSIEGDLIMPVPSWVSYTPQAEMLGQNVIEVPAHLDKDGYHLRIDALRAAVDQARAQGLNPTKLIFNTPNNPTGLMVPEDELPALAQYCREEDIFIISDEIYGKIAYGAQHASIAKYAPERTAITGGLSKHISLGGWRIGVALLPKAIPGLFELMRAIASETWSSVASPIQAASIEAYKNHADVEQHIQECTDIHGFITHYIAKSLADAGVNVAMPQGAFYNFPDFSPFREALKQKGIVNSVDLNAYLLEHHGIVALPGQAFGSPDKDVLTLRLSSCDYDGGMAQQAYHNSEPLNDDFIARYAPRVQAGVQQFLDFIAQLKATAPLQKAV